jgi:uncharacterized repeat protein (TIGR03803 family)
LTSYSKKIGGFIIMKISFMKSCVLAFHAVGTLAFLSLFVFANSIGAAEAQTLTTLHTFTGGADGGYPFSGVIRDANGNLYGATEFGGNLNCNSPLGCGAVFSLDPTGKETVLHAFTGTPDGQAPASALLLGPGGNLYGTTSEGGKLSGCQFGGSGCGTVFKLNPVSKEQILYAFAGGADVAIPFAGVAQDGNDNLYGSAYYGGAFADGGVYRIDNTGKESVLHSFSGAPSDGANPNSTPVLQGGAIVGTTTYGGSGPCNNGFAVGCGVLFKLDQNGETVVHSFSGPEGSYPVEVIPGTAGTLYGIANQGGSFGQGTVFEVNATGTVFVLYSFAGGSDGSHPYGLVQDGAGNFYGVTSSGGSSGSGTIFKLSPNGSGGWTEAILYSFSGGADGSGPQTGLALDASTRNLYGTTCCGAAGYGTVFRLTY